MKEIVLISAYTPDVERQDNLRDLIKSLKKFNYRVCLITHTSTPQDIIDKCDYFIFDKENEILYDPNMKYHYYFYLNDLSIRFKDYISMATHMIPVFRMYLGGLSYLKSMGEEIIHMIEYDTIVKNRNIWDRNLEILKEKDAVFYSFPRFYENDKLKCVYSFQSLNVKNIPHKFLNFNKSELINQYSQYVNEEKVPIFERMIFDNMWSKLNFHLEKLSSEEDLEESFTTNIIRVGTTSDTPPVEKTNINYYNNKFHFFHHNDSSSSNNFLVIINKDKILNFEIQPTYWNWIPLDYDEIYHIQIFKNNVLLKELDLTTKEGRDWVFKHSYANILHSQES